ncbi:MAG TPA: FecR family protein, partial [Kofleriaceae bacterium]|nr:FecR family protein [Kofleriaceae bacterium]
MVTAVALGLLVGAGCKKSNDPSAKETPKTQEAKQPATPAAKDTPAAGANGDATTAVGVQAGGLQHADKEGPAAVLAKLSGTVEVRRVGEPAYAAAKQDTKLYPGDVVRTGDGGTATVTLADESTVELAETTALAIASRDGTADPASATAVLEGLARFSVTSRAPAEGPFRVYTPTGVIVTRGTTYGVGVAASGEARVGVESGTVEVIGLSKMDAAPVAVEKSTQVVLAADGTVGTPAPWPADDWGTWRDDTESKLQVTAAVDAHGKAMTALQPQLVDGYAQLQVSADQAATFEATAATSAEKSDPTAYEAALPEGAATIDASFSLGARLEALTWAYVAHAELATDL